MKTYLPTYKHLRSKYAIQHMYTGTPHPSKLRKKLQTYEFCAKSAIASLLLSGNMMWQRSEAISADHCRKAENLAAAAGT